jgi:hypothetical protein
MNAEVFAEWLRRQGHDVIQTASSYWYDVAPRVYQAFPYHWVVNPPESELADVLRERGGIALRYSTDLERPSGRMSYHVVYDKSSYSLASLPKKARHDVSHGLRYATYQPIPMSDLASEGWKLRSETLVRQGRAKAETWEFWQRLCQCAEGLGGFEAWGAIHEGELVAALLAHTCEGTVSILYQQSRTGHLRHGVNNALTYSFTQTVLQRPDARNLFYGLHSLDAPSGVDGFKFRMRYLAKPVRQRVVFSPVVRPFINRLSHGLLKACRNAWPSNSTIAKAEGMVRFHLEGRRPLSEQVWPDGLLHEKEAILGEAAERRVKALQESSA